MKLVIMTKPTFFVEEDKILSSLFDEGLDMVHLWKPGASPILSERLLTLLPESYHRRITVHEHYYLKAEYNLAGIHLDEDEAVPSDYKGRVSRTCRKIEKLKETKKRVEYVFLRNVFSPISFSDECSNFTLKDLEAAADSGLIDRRVYALGGMTSENLRIARELGFGGVVICGDLWNRFNIFNEKDYKELMCHFERLRANC